MKSPHMFGANSVRNSGGKLSEMRGTFCNFSGLIYGAQKEHKNVKHKPFRNPVGLWPKSFCSTSFRKEPRIHSLGVGKVRFAGDLPGHALSSPRSVSVASFLL